MDFIKLLCKINKIYNYNIYNICNIITNINQLISITTNAIMQYIRTEEDI